MYAQKKSVKKIKRDGLSPAQLERNRIAIMKAQKAAVEKLKRYGPSEAQKAAYIVWNKTGSDRAHDLWVSGNPSEGQLASVQKAVKAMREKWQSMPHAPKVVLTCPICGKDFERVLYRYWLERVGVFSADDYISSGKYTCGPGCNGVSSWRKRIEKKACYNHKVVSVEPVSAIEDSYDLTVESSEHNFALACGVFVHNSGQEFEVIVPKTANQGVEVTNVGGEVDVKAIKDLETQYNKLFAALKMQPSQIGFGEEQANAIGDTSGQSYDRRLARTCRMVVYSVTKAIRNFDYLYLRSRGYDVSYKDWNYGTVSLSVMEDQARAEVLAKAVENLKAITEAFSSMQLENYNKEYLVDAVLGTPLSSTGIDVQEILKVPENKEETELVPGGDIMGGSEDQQLLASFAFRKKYMDGVFDVMENAKIMPLDFINAARKSLEGTSDKKLITSVTQTKGSVSYAALDEVSYIMPEDTPVDVTGVVFFMKGPTEQICSDLDKSGKKFSEMVTLDFGQTVLIPSDVKLTIKDFNTSGVRALNKAYINSRGELIITDKNDIAVYLAMKKSGLFSCLVSRLVEVP
jgi:hypothetical protein